MWVFRVGDYFCRQACGFLDLANIFVDRHVGFLARLKKPTCLCRKNGLYNKKKKSQNPHACAENWTQKAVLSTSMWVYWPRRKKLTTGMWVFRVGAIIFVNCIQKVVLLTGMLVFWPRRQKPMTGMWVFSVGDYFCRQACGFLDLAIIFVDRHVGFFSAPQKTHMPAQKK